MKAAIVAPDVGKTKTFYTYFTDCMQLMAQQLNIELEVHDCGLDRDLMVQRGKEICTRASPPDFLIITNSRGVGKQMLEAANEAGIKSFVVCEGLLFSDRAAVGLPRQESPLWLGELLPDDDEAGALLAKTLIKEAENKGMTAKDGKIHFKALGGDLTVAALLRANGLRSVCENANVALNLVSAGGWNVENGRLWAAQLLAQDEETAVFWAANDAIAMGAVEAIRASGRIPGRDILVGGIDWMPEMLELVKQGVVTTSIGGHFMDGAWSLILLYDHYHGCDFSEASMSSHWDVATAANAQSLLALYHPSTMKRLDLTQFSKVKNPSLQQYDFSVASLMAKLR